MYSVLNRNKLFLFMNVIRESVFSYVVRTVQILVSGTLKQSTWNYFENAKLIKRSSLEYAVMVSLEYNIYTFRSSTYAS